MLLNAAKRLPPLFPPLQMNFVEGIFSWVFGDGDPNVTYQERRWRALGRHIQKL